MLNRFLSEVPLIQEIEMAQDALAFISDNNSIEEADVILNEKVLQSDLAVLGEVRMAKIIDLFRVSSKDNLVQLQHAIINRDVYQVNQLAHKLKGSAGSLGLMQLHALCHSYEEKGKSGDVSGCSDIEISQVYGQSIEALNTFFDK